MYVEDHLCITKITYVNINGVQVVIRFISYTVLVAQEVYRAILTYMYVCRFTYQVLYIQQVWVMLGASVQEYNYAWMHANVSRSEQNFIIQFSQNQEMQNATKAYE